MLGAALLFLFAARAQALTTAGVATPTLQLTIGAGRDLGATPVEEVATPWSVPTRYPPARARPENRRDTLQVRGVVRGPDGEPVEGVNVFLTPGLEGDATGAGGRFAITTAAGGERTLVVKAPGFSTLRRPVTPPASSLVIRLDRVAVPMEGLAVVARESVTGRTEVQMTSLDVVRTPGSNADPFRALQSEPGVLAVDEGVGLHLQGGAVSETRVLMDGITMVAPFRTSSATGLDFGSFDAFLLEEISLATAGFDARVGDALSGVVRGKTRGRPDRSGAEITATAVGASGRIEVASSAGLGARVTGGFTDFDRLLDLHGREDEFLSAPRGEEGSLSLSWEREPGTEVKLFALGRRDRFASREEGREGEPFRWESDDYHIALSGERVLGSVSASGALGASGADRERTFGTFRLGEDDRLLQARGSAAWSVSSGLTFRSGGVLERRAVDLEGALDRPAGTDGGGSGPEGEGVLFASRVRAVRRGGFLQAEWEANARLALKSGVRVDHSTLTDATTFDPRLTAFLHLGEQTEMELAWGRYHQVPEPLAAEPTVGAAELEPMESTHWTASLRAPGPGPLDRLHLRLYHKASGSLIQEDRTNRLVAGGEGTATGADLRATAVAPGDVEFQAALSVLDADRTDPNTGVVARSPFEASPSLTVLASRSWVGRGTEDFELGLAYTHGRGRPFTPVVDARFASDRGVWIPAFGAPRSERLPDLRRLDVSATWLRQLWEGNLTTVFLTVSNLLDRRNISDIRYNRDFSEAIPVRSAFERTVFLGATTTFPF